MKFKIAALAALSAAAVGAHAQSSVTMFGVVDVNVRYVNNTDLPSNMTMNNSGLSSGRLGFRGVEDLGGGLKAGFWLESDVNADTGTTSATGKFFQRRSTLSLMGNFGEVRLGRDFTPASQIPTIYDPFSVIGLANGNITSRLPTAFANYYRHDNAVQYFSPVFAGLKLELMYAMDERTTDNMGQHTGARVVYDNGPLSLSLAYGQTKANAGGANLKQTGFGASYDLGMVKLTGMYQRDTLPFGTYGTAAVAAGSENRYMLGAIIPVGNNLIRASYTRTDSRGGSAAYNDSDADKYAIGYVHNMSRRTAVYGTLAHISNKGGANFALAGGAAGLAAGGKSTGMEFGIRHAF